MLNFLRPNYWKYFYIYLRASSLVEKEQYDKTIKIIEDFLKKKVFATEAIYYVLGRAHLGKKNYKLAIESFNVAIEYNSSDDIYKANSRYFLGLAFFESEQALKAIEAFKKAIQIKKRIRFYRDAVISLPHIYCYLGRAYAKLDNLEEAYKSFNEGLKFEPNNKALQRELTLLGI